MLKIVQRIFMRVAELFCHHTYLKNNTENELRIAKYDLTHLIFVQFVSTNLVNIIVHSHSCIILRVESNEA